MNNPSQKCDYNYETCCNNLEKHCPADQLPEEPEYSYCKKCGDHCRYQVKKSRIPKSEKCKNGKPCPWCQSESPATPKLSDSCKHKWKYKEVNGVAIRQCIKCGHSSRGITCYQSKSSELGKAMQPVGGVSENKPSTGEDWEKGWKKIKDQYSQSGLFDLAADAKDSLDLDVANLFRSLLQQERERSAAIVERQKEIASIHSSIPMIFNCFDEAKQQILKDNQ